MIRAGLVETLNGSGQLTVFAPTDEAFVSFLGAADEESAIAAIETIDAGALTDILLYRASPTAAATAARCWPRRVM